MKWLDVGEIEVTSGTLAMGDCLYFPEYQAQATVINGIYSVQVMAQMTGLRAILKNQTLTRQAAPLDEIQVDFEVVGVCDYEAFRLVFETTFTCKDEKEAHYVSHFGNPHGVVQVAGLPMVYSQAGRGDGLYLVYSYVNENNAMAGMEVVFIEDGGEVE